MHGQSFSSASVSHSSTGTAGKGSLTRVASIDIFRGLTMLVMIFVNDLASVKGLPWWTYHMPGESNGMTYVDMVFPAFLFIVGMSLPLSVNAKLKRGISTGQLWLHVILRAIGLVVLGLILANAGKADRTLTGIEPNLWALAALTGAVLFWNAYHPSERFCALFRVLKIAGLLLLALMFAIFRRTTPDGHIAWIDISYWEILGLIGWTYLGIAILYIPTRRRRWAPVAWFALLLLLNISTTARWMSWPDHLPLYIWPFGSGALCLIAMAGVITSNIFWDVRHEAFAQRGRVALYVACFSLAAAWLLTPLGVSKIRATPTWCLYSAGTSVILFAVLYWICDVRKRTAWAWAVRPAGANTLLTYLLPDLYYFALAGSGLALRFGEGGPGVLRSVVFTFAMLALAAVLTRWRVQMQL